MADEPLPLPVYARALAHLVSHRDQPIENVLGTLGITMADLAAADAHYSEQLRGAYRKRRGVLAMTFAEAFAEARVERGLLGADSPHAAIAPARPAPAPAPPPPESPALPSYLSAPAASAQMAPVAPAPVPPVPVAPAAAAPAPVAPAAPVSVASAAPAPPAPASAGVPRGTADLQLPQVRPQSLPFQPGAAASAQAVSSPAQPAAPGPGTGTVLAPADAPRGGELPWDAAQVRERIGKLTLAHFAALTIEVGRNPPDLAPVLRRYGLSTPEDLRHVTAAFHAQMSVDPGMKAQFEALLARMRSMSGQR